VFPQHTPEVIGGLGKRALRTDISSLLSEETEEGYVATERQSSQALKVCGGKIRFWRGKIFLFYICLKQIFLGTRTFGGHKKFRGELPPNASAWPRDSEKRLCNCVMRKDGMTKRSNIAVSYQVNNVGSSPRLYGCSIYKTKISWTKSYEKKTLVRRTQTGARRRFRATFAISLKPIFAKPQASPIPTREKAAISPVSVDEARVDVIRSFDASDWLQAHSGALVRQDINQAVLELVARQVGADEAGSGCFLACQALTIAQDASQGLRRQKADCRDKATALNACSAQPVYDRGIPPQTDPRKMPMLIKLAQL